MHCRYEDKHGEKPEHVHKVMPYNCTNVVPTLPARMAIFSDSCSLWKKSGHIEDETHKKLVGMLHDPLLVSSHHWHNSAHETILSTSFFPCLHEVRCAWVFLEAGQNAVGC